MTNFIKLTQALPHGQTGVAYINVDQITRFEPEVVENRALVHIHLNGEKVYVTETVDEIISLLNVSGIKAPL